MHVCCEDCGWTQDQFWTEVYNPLKILYDQNVNILLRKKLSDIDTKTNKPYIHIITHALAQTIDIISKMKWQTKEEWEQDTKKKCPVCGSKEITLCFD